MKRFHAFNSSASFGLLALVALAGLGQTSPVSATNFTWDGQLSDVWNAMSGSPPNAFTNWNPDLGVADPIPDADDVVGFAAFSFNTTVDMNGDRTVQAILFGGTTDYTITPGGVFTLTLATGDVTTSGPATHEITADIALGDTGDWTINNSLFKVSGTISGAYALNKSGAGTLELTGGDDATPSSLTTLRSESGAVVVDGARIDLTSTDISLTTGALSANSGDMTLQNGADVRLAAGSFGLVKNATLTVTGAGTSLTGARLDAAESAANTGSIILQDSASLDLAGSLLVGFHGDGSLSVESGATGSANSVYLSITGSGAALVTGSDSLLSTTDNLNLGGQDDSSLGGTGTLTVEDGGAVQVANQTIFWTSSSSVTVTGATFETDRLTNYTGVVGTISISDPAGDAALTVGAGDGSSTFDGLIQDAGGGPGSLKKVGGGALTLTNANTYSGDTIIDAGKIIVANADTLQNSTVNINVDNGLDITTNTIDTNIGALAGSGALSLGSQTLTTGQNDSNTTYSGVITGASDSILKHNGAGVLTLTGGTNAIPSSFGTLRSANADGVIVIDGARIDLTNNTTSPFLAKSGDITLQNGADVRVDEDRYSQVNNSLLTVKGNGTSLTGSRLDVADLGTDTGSMLVKSKASVALTGDLVVGFAGDGDLTVQSGATGSAGSVDLGITGSGAALVTGSGSLLSATNDLNLGGQATTSLGGMGTLTVEDSGDVQVGNLTQFWTSTSSVTVNGGTFETNKLTNYTGVVGTISISDPAGDAALTVGAGGGSSIFDGLIQDAGGGPGSLKKVGAGALTLTNANTYSGDTIIDAGKIIVANADTLQNSTVNINVDNGLDITTNTIDANLGALAGSGALDIGSQSLTAGSNDSSAIYSGVLSGAVGAFTKAGGGTLVLTGSNTYSGGTVIERGVLSVSDDSNLGDASGDVEIKTGATLNVWVSHATSRLYFVTKAVGLDSATIWVDALQTYTINGPITGNVGPTFRGPGTIVLNGGNTFDATQSSGVLTVLEATVQISSDANLGDPSVDVTFAGSLPTLQVTATHSTYRSFAFYDSNQRISVDAGQVYTINGNIEAPNSNGFDKLGNGALELTADNSFDGGVRVNGGTLLANNTTGSATGSGTVQVNSGASLGGTGSVAGTVTVASGGSVAPGMPAGTLGIGGDLNLQASSSLDIELGGLTAGTEHDRIEVTGFADLLGNLNVTLINSFTPSAGTGFAFLFADGGFNVAFGSLNLPDLSAFNLDWQLNPGDSTLFLDVVSTGVPGDYNGNGIVDAADYTVWRDALAAGATDLWNDPTPGAVDESDFAYWRNHFGETVGSGAGSVASVIPEPSTVALFLLGSLLALQTRHKRPRDNTV